MKGQVQLDYIVAIGIFIILFVIIVQTATTYFTTAESTAELSLVTGYAGSLLKITDYGFNPANWSGSFYTTNVTIALGPSGTTRQVNISLTGASSNLTNYPVRIVVPYDSDMRSDYGDLRFYNSTNSLLSYWVENYTASNATVWVVTNVPMAGTNISLYYGNASLTTGSNLTAVWGSSLVGLWTFDEGNTTTTFDLSGYGNNGSLGGAIASRIPALAGGRYGSAYSFNSSTEIIGNNTASLNITTPFTLSAWVNLNNTAQNDRGLVGKWANGPGYMLYYNSGAFYFYVDGTFVNNGTGITANKWYYVAGVWNGTTMNLYINGTLAGSVAKATGPTAHTGRLQFADYGDPGDRMAVSGLNGFIDQVRIYNRSLAPTELQFADSEPVATFGPESSLTTSTGINFIPLNRIGIGARMYSFIIVVNNSKTFYIDQTKNATTLSSELVTFNYTDLGFSNVDINSTFIYRDGEIPYNINGNNITFVTSLSVNETRYFTVYFDEDSNFTSKSTAVSGSNNLSEKILAVQPLAVIQYKKLQILNATDYGLLLNSTGNREFYLVLRDVQDTPNKDFFSYGGTVPRTGNIVSLQRYFLYQNATGGVRQGKLTVQVW